MVDCGLCVVKENMCACFGGDNERSLQELGGLSLQRIQAVLGQDASGQNLL